MDEREKTQIIRIIDVVGIGPLMIYAGAKAESDLPKSVRAALIIAGVATIGYNGMNYLANEEEHVADRLKEDADLDAKLESMVGEVEES